MADNEQIVVAKELRDRSDAELRSLMETKAEELHKMKFTKALGQLQETHMLTGLKRDIARLKTVLRERKAKEPLPAATPEEPLPAATPEVRHE